MSFIEDVERTEKELKFIHQIEKWEKSYKKVQWIKDSKEFTERKCRNCGETKFYYVYLKRDDKFHCIMAYCINCGNYQMQQMPHNANARTNTNLSKWSFAVRYRDEEKCTICGSTENLNAHHIVPVSIDRSKMYDVENGICLCKNCHDFVHKYLSAIDKHCKQKGDDA